MTTWKTWGRWWAAAWSSAPVVVGDLLLTLAIESAFAPIWSDEIIDEIRRNVLANHPGITPDQFDKARPLACASTSRQRSSVGMSP